MRKAGYVCQYANCLSKISLQVHHLTYVNLGHEPLRDLMVLCETHHALTHLLEKLCQICGFPIFDEEAGLIWLEPRLGTRSGLKRLLLKTPFLCPHCRHAKKTGP